MCSHYKGRYFRNYFYVPVTQVKPDIALQLSDLEFIFNIIEKLNKVEEKLKKKKVGQNDKKFKKKKKCQALNLFSILLKPGPSCTKPVFAIKAFCTKPVK